MTLAAPTVDELLTPDEVAAILRVSRKQVLRLPLRRVMLGRRTVRFDRADVAAYVAQRKIGRVA